MFLILKKKDPFFESQVKNVPLNQIDSRLEKIKQYLMDLYNTKEEQEILKDSLKIESGSHSILL